MTQTYFLLSESTLLGANDSQGQLSYTYRCLLNIPGSLTYQLNDTHHFIHISLAKASHTAMPTSRERGGIMVLHDWKRRCW